MPPKKKSIRDFFKPLAKASEVVHDSAAQQPGMHTRSKAPAALQEEFSRHNKTLRDSPHSHFSKQTSPKPNDSQTTNSTNTNPPRNTTSNNPSFTTSQSSAHSGSTSKRVVSNGEDVVLNSDSDSDSLPELDWNISSKPLNVQKPKPTIYENDLRKPPEQRKKNGKAFINFFQDAQRIAQSERQIAEVKADLEKPAVEEPLSTRFDINEDTLENIIRDDDDPDKAKKLLQAMRRTNALQTDSVFHLWRRDWADDVMSSRPFPIDSLPNHQWTSIFEETSSRNQAFASGFALQIFRMQHLPIELASWMIDQSTSSAFHILGLPLTTSIQNHPGHLQTLLDRARISAIFNGIGADPLCLDQQQPVAPSFEFEDEARIPFPDSLNQICRLLQTTARCLNLDASSHILYILFHVCMDVSVASDATTLGIVQHTIENIICNVSDNQDLASILNDIVPSFLKRVDHPVLQCQLIESLPAISPFTAYLQRHLALSFLLHPKTIKTPLQDHTIPILLDEYLQNSSHFLVDKNTNYTHLAARLTMLDIAIGPGLSSVPYQPLLSLPPSPIGEEAMVLPTHLTGDEKTFNEQVDALAHHIEFISSSIVESGGIVDLSRLQAKDCSERIYHRLQNAVRIGGKKKYNIFGTNEVDFDRAVWKGFAKISAKRNVNGRS
ncbi:hypothetical protein DM02DRAFT_656590 [Periconia macrospinosa]|uniref:Uncharacterized protein n=1 Tax=Periconia macrospinosa TaxID=97972 RepID=A0A2V1DM35_9PLEO|nr:hypothetical protein DM02DRAFT_656590 [Periconia macrospinosa]